jgi:two-component system CheB/CheR fusion protein
VRRNRFDVVISDIAMPGMDGMRLLQRIRELPKHESVAAIACSGFNRQQDVRKAMDAGFDAHVSKPIGMRDLIDTILRVSRRPR